MPSDTIRLYQSTSSPNSRRVRIVLAEKRLSIPLVAVDLAKGEQHSEAYRAINPRRVVPTLVLEDGTAIGEVILHGPGNVGAPVQRAREGIRPHSDHDVFLSAIHLAHPKGLRHRHLVASCPARGTSAQVADRRS